MSNKAYKNLNIDRLPDRLSDSEVITYINTVRIGASQLEKFKKLSSRKDEVLSRWFNVSVRTFRNYKTTGAVLKTDIKEKLILLLSLYKHGEEVFGSIEDFNAWLQEENFYFDGATPDSFLDTVSGIRFAENRLTAIEYGDNV